MKITYVCSHPIQYHAPLLRLLAAVPGADFEAVYKYNTASGSYDSEFGMNIKWDIDLTDGYTCKFLGDRNIDGDIVLLYRFCKYMLVRRPDIVWVHGFSNLFNLSAIAISKLLGCKVYLRDDVHLKMRDRSRIDNLKSYLVFFVLRMSLTGFLAVGTANKKYLLSRGVSLESITTVPNAVDNVMFQRKQYFDSTLGTKLASLKSKYEIIILFCGKLIALKRVNDLIAAISLLPPEIGLKTCLVVVGEGKEHLELEAEAARLKVNARFVGFINQSEMPIVYQFSDVLVLPSSTESWGLVINEAMNGHCAIICTDRVGAAEDLVKSGYNGYVYKSGDVVRLSEALCELALRPRLLEEFKTNSATLIQKWDYSADIEGLRIAFGLAAAVSDVK